ncbi:hypothetical protein AY599_27140 [Leptolyngbya valderiana BDU 20041]|nr:hypothetical protein [Geitlerinema sp. CS-897]OAB62727.1 hypothetical protein AY599_27140 [Leptolyngbya valderiana BDU 20041]
MTDRWGPGVGSGKTIRDIPSIESFRPKQLLRSREFPQFEIAPSLKLAVRSLWLSILPRPMKRERQLWLTKGIAGLLSVGFGLSLFGEAVIRKSCLRSLVRHRHRKLSHVRLRLVLDERTRYNHQRRLETHRVVVL